MGGKGGYLGISRRAGRIDQSTAMARRLCVDPLLQRICCDFYPPYNLNRRCGLGGIVVVLRRLRSVAQRCTALHSVALRSVA